MFGLFFEPLNAGLQGSFLAARFLLRRDRQRALGAPILLRVAPARQIGLCQGVRLKWNFHALGVDQHDFHRLVVVLKQARIDLDQLSAQQDGVQSDRGHEGKGHTGALFRRGRKGKRRRGLGHGLADIT